MPADNRIEVSGQVVPNTPTEWLGRAKAVGASTTANASLFTAIASVLGKLASDATALDTAEAAAKNRGKDDVQTRNTKWKALRRSYRATVLAVQGLCDDAADDVHARALCVAAGLQANERAIRTKKEFAADDLGNGCVRLTVKVPVKKGARCFYEWRMSNDGGKSWTILSSTNDCTTLVTGLTPATTVEFSFRYTSKNVVSAWSNGLPVIVK
jgi:hypothetical protein